MSCNCGIVSDGFFGVIVIGGFIAKFDPTGSSLIYSTYFQTAELSNPLSAIALASDGSVYIGGLNGIYRLNAAGSALLATLPLVIGAQAMAVAPDGTLYVAGGSQVQLQNTAGAFEPVPGPPTALAQNILFPAPAIAKIDSQLAKVLSATYFGGSYPQFETTTF